MSEEEKTSILIVDDDAANIRILNNILKTEYTVYVAKSGKSAIQRAKDDKPDLILLDIIMPDMNGYEVLIELKESDETRSIPVIFLTGLDNVENEEKGFFLGAVDYIKKPFHNSIVKARIKNHVKIVRYIRTIEKLCMIDTLTEIPNRRCFDTHIQKSWVNAIAEQKAMSLLMIDVDKFKEFNDTYGHPHGDILLHELAKIFSDSLKNTEDMAARIGGEEFAVILPEDDKEEALITAERIMNKVREMQIRTPDGLNHIKVTISIGINTVIPREGDEMNEFIRQADEMLYMAKSSGRNKVVAYGNDTPSPKGF